MLRRALGLGGHRFVSLTEAREAARRGTAPVTRRPCLRLPAIGATPVGDVTSGDVLDILKPIWTPKRETARKVKRRISAVMKWAVAQGYPAAAAKSAITRRSPTARWRRRWRP